MVRLKPVNPPLTMVTRAKIRVLIIYNYTRHLYRIHDMLAELLPNAEIKVVDRLHVRTIKWQDYDLIFLTGGNGRHYVLDERKLKGQRAIIKECTKPMIGICLGAELMVATLGGKLHALHKVRRWHIPLHLTEKGEQFIHVPDEFIKVYESHKIHITEVPDDLEVLATSKDGIEAFRHKQRPMWGVQFHPEVMKRYNHGAHIVSSALKDIL